MPARQAHVVERRRLLDLVTRAVDNAPFTLVCAPAGSGKTVLASRWADRRQPLPLGWLTVTDRDNEPPAFWWHVRSALADAGAIQPGTRGEPFPGAGDVDLLGHELLRSGRTVVLVLDAAERLQRQEVFDGLASLLDGTAGLLRVLVTTRQEPPMPLHRYRLEGTVAELGLDELAFTRAELKTLLELHQVSLADDTTQHLLDRTQGWAAGARLAALALRADAADTALETLGADYLAAEVYDTLSDTERDLLLRVSVVDEVSPGLGAVLSGRPDAERLLKQLSRRNAFVQRVRGQPGCYRIHPLFREFLAEQRVANGGPREHDLHRCAADWYGTDGQVLPAVDHAIAADDWNRAAEWIIRLHGVVDLALPTATGTGLAARLSAMPELDSADVHLVRAGMSLGRGDLDVARDHMARTEGAEHRSEWLLSAAVVFTRLNELAGDVDATLQFAHRARSEAAALQRQDDVTLATLMALVTYCEGAAHLSAGDLDTAAEVLDAALLAATATSCDDLRLRCLATPALVEACRGQLGRAQERAFAAERVAKESGGTAHRPAALDLAHAWVALERQDLPRAQHALAQADRIGETRDSALLRSVSLLLRARLKRDHGDGVAARGLLQTPESRVGWLRRSFDAEAAAVGLLASVAELQPDHDVQPRPLPGWDLAIEAPTRVEELLESARIHRIRGDARASRSDISEALSLAQDERRRRPFAHAAPEIRAMIRNDRDLRSRADWLRPETSSGDPSHPQARSPIIEELSERELEVLRHLSALLTTEEIAAEMFISANTVRTHVRRILGKLSVSKRHEAVRRARELELI